MNEDKSIDIYSDKTQNSVINKKPTKNIKSSENTTSKNKKSSTNNKHKYIDETQKMLLNIIKSAEEKYKNRQININYRKSLGITAEAVNPEQVDEEKRNILHRACLQIKLSIIQDLEQQLTPQYVQKLDKFGNTPLILACKLPLKGHNFERSEILKILIKAGADIQCTEPINGWTALHWCCFNGDIISTKTLINNGANFFLPCKKGFFPIDLAAQRSHSDLVKYLISILIQFLEKIQNYELLNLETQEKKLVVKKLRPSRILFDNINKRISNQDIYEPKLENNKDLNPNEIKEIDLSKLPKINQTVYLRLYTEHCLYWIGYYNYSIEIIKKFLFKFYAHPAFPIFCLNNQTALHGCCIQGSKIPFKELLNRYENKRAIREKLCGKSKKEIPQYMDNSGLKNFFRISYPVEYQQYQQKLETSIHFNSLNKKFKNYILKHYFKLIYPKSYVENLPLEKIVDKEGNTPIILAAKYNKYEFLDFIQENQIINNIHELLNADNKIGYAGYYYLKNHSFKNNLLRKHSNKIYPIPLVVLDLNNNSLTKASINLIMKIGISEKLEIELMEHIDNSRIYILINITEEYFFEQAEKEKLHIKLLKKNLKLPFENDPKYISNVEPFLSRHYQYIIIKTISNLFDIEMLKEQKILNDIFLIHLPNVATKIYNTFIKRKIYVSNPLCFVGDYFFEGKNRPLSQIQLLYRYFGQAIAMYYAFYGFFTMMYLPLAFISLLYTLIYLKSLFNTFDMYPTCFLIFAIWNLVIIARWKRKSEEIQHKWGMKISQDQQKMRNEFKGDEYYSDLDAPLEKYRYTKTGVISFFVGLPVLLAFVAIVMFSSHYVTLWEDKVQDEKNYFFRFFPSFLRALSLVVIYYIYDHVVLKLTKIGNIKYEDEYEFIIIIRIFLFRFINDFISAFYNVFLTKNIYRLKVLLYTNIIFRFLAEIVIRISFPVISNYFSKKKYFNKKDTKEKEIIDDNDIKKGEKDIKLQVGKDNPKKIGNRVSFITGKELDNQNKDLLNLNPDFIEMQNLLQKKKELFYDYADIFMIHSLISQFIIIIPFAPLICFIFSIFSQNAKLYLDIFYLKRASPSSCRGIRIWNKLFEFNSIFMTVTNSFLYYYYGNNNYFNMKVASNTEISVSSNEQALMYIVVAEHIILIIQYILKHSFPEVPKWVRKERENLIGYYGLLNSNKERKENIGITLGIERLKSEIRKINEEIDEQKLLLKKYEKNTSDFKSNLFKKEGKLKEYEDALNLLYNSARKKLYFKEKISYPRLRTLVMTNKKIENITLDNYSDKIDSNTDYNLFYSQKKVENYIDIKFDFILQQLINELSPQNALNIYKFQTYNSYNFDSKNFSNWEKDLRKSYCFYQMKNTFEQIEKIILAKKLQLFLKSNDTPFIVCSSCAKKNAEYKCYNCDEFFCPECKSIHVSNQLWEEHKIVYYQLPLKKTKEKDSVGVPFIKGESFSFPNNMGNNYGYKNLLNIFDLFYTRYISNNGISDDNKINFKESVFNKYDFYSFLQTIPSKVIEEQIEFLSNDNLLFNLTELFFINRICFKVFKFFGAKANIDRVYFPLKQLQISTFERKVIILLNLLDIYDNKLILKNEFIKFFTFMNYQSFSEEFSIDSIIEIIFRESEETTFIEFSKAYENIVYNQKLASVFKYLLQDNKDEEVEEEEEEREEFINE